MDQTPDAILEFAADIARKTWDKGKGPFKLPDLAPALKEAGINYHDVLGGQRLRAFLLTAPQKVKVVVHPTQRANIVLIPPEETFEWPEGTSKSSPMPSFNTPLVPEFVGNSKRRYIVSNFLRLVSELSDDDAAQVQIPTHILIKLMRDR